MFLITLLFLKIFALNAHAETSTSESEITNGPPSKFKEFKEKIVL